MLALDRDALMCDMAETYRIYDIRSLPASRIAMFACGLGVNSRIKLRKEGLKAPWEVVLLAEIIDLLSTEESANLTSIFLIEDKRNKPSEFQTFESIEEFEQAKAKIIAGAVTEEELSYGGD